MLRISIHSSLPSQASRYNRTDWIDIGYQDLKAFADYKIVLVESGKGARQPVHMKTYPRWSSSLWDLAARAMALAYWKAPPSLDIHRVPAFTATDQDGEPVPVEEVEKAKPVQEPVRCEAWDVEVPLADDVGNRCAFAMRTTALITHYPSKGTGGRRLGTLLIVRDKKLRCLYRGSVEEDSRPRRILDEYMFAPAYLSPTELVIRTCLHALGSSINLMPPVPRVHWPEAEEVAGEKYVSIHRIGEPARTGFLRWLAALRLTPKPEMGASQGRVPMTLYAKFLSTAV